MASYSYKDVCNQIPPHIEERFELLYGREHDGDPNYSGDYWTLAGMWIDELLDDVTPNPLTVEVPIETIRHLLRRDAEFGALEAAGVDSWDGYSEADYEEADSIITMSKEDIKKLCGGK